MTTIRATVQGRRVEVDVPADWPDGTPVEIHPQWQCGSSDIMSPEEVARTLAAMDRIEPLEMTDAQQAAWDAQRQARKARDKAEFVQRAEGLGRDWP